MEKYSKFVSREALESPVTGWALVNVDGDVADFYEVQQSTLMLTKLPKGWKYIPAVRGYNPAKLEYDFARIGHDELEIVVSGMRKKEQPTDK